MCTVVYDKDHECTAVKNTSESESLGFICFLIAARLTYQSPDSFCHSTSHLLTQDGFCSVKSGHTYTVGYL